MPPLDPLIGTSDLRTGRDHCQDVSFRTFSPRSNPDHRQVFVRRALVERGAFVLEENLRPKLNTGVHLGLGVRMANKGAVGLSCRLHDLALAFVTAHFAADKHSQARVHARNQVGDHRRTAWAGPQPGIH
jgi:hypothetical protein